MTKVTWFSRGSGSLGVLQSSTVPSTLRGCVDERGSDPDDPPVSRTMFKEESEEEKIVQILIQRSLTLLKSGVVFICEVVLKNVAASVHPSTLENCLLNPVNKH